MPAMPITNQWGGIPGGMSFEPAYAGGQFGGGYAPGGVGSVNIPSAYSANQTNYIASHNAMVADPAYKSAVGFLNPNDPTAMRDVAQKGAEHAVGTGMVGSGQAGQYTGRLRQYDIERRAALGNQILSGAYGRQPAPVNPYAQAQLQLEQANQENQRLLQSIKGRYAPTGGISYAPPGGGRSAPMMVGGGVGGYGGGGGGGGALPIQNVPRTATIPRGGNQVAYGQGGEDWNAANQATQFYKGEYKPGEVYFGAKETAPIWPTPPPVSDEDFSFLTGGEW